jgi:hypothetical protein
MTHDLAHYLNEALEASRAELRRCDPKDTRLRQRLQAEANLVSATFGLITGDNVDEARKEWNEAADDFA